MEPIQSHPNFAQLAGIYGWDGESECFPAYRK